MRQKGGHAIARTTLLEGDPATVLASFLSGGEPCGVLSYREYDRHAALGRQPVLPTYGVPGTEFRTPDPEKLRTLFAGIRSVAPGMRTLHIDNANLGTTSHHEETTREVPQVIVDSHTAGDTAAFGVESVDSAIIQRRLSCTVRFYSGLSAPVCWLEESISGS